MYIINFYINIYLRSLYLINITFKTDTTHKQTDRVTYRDASHLKSMSLSLFDSIFQRNINIVTMRQLH